MTNQTDSVVRAMTNDGSFRVIVAITTETVRDVARLQSASGVTVEHLGNLVTGTILLRETMAPQLRMQGILRGAGQTGTLVADSHPDGTTRGLVNRSNDQAVRLGDGAMLQVMRSLPSGQVHQGVVEVSDARGLTDAFMVYMQTSEQVASTMDVGLLAAESSKDGVLAAGGYIVQLLPELAESMLAIMTERLAHFEPMHQLLAKGLGVRDVLSELLYGMEFTELESSALQFGCNCSQVRIVAALSTLQRTEIEELVRDGEILHICCDFCTKQYNVHPEQLRGLLEPS